MGDQAEEIHESFPSAHTHFNSNTFLSCYHMSEQIDSVHIIKWERATIPMGEGFTNLLNRLSY